jgi:hypothetical protein
VDERSRQVPLGRLCRLADNFRALRLVAPGLALRTRPRNEVSATAARHSRLKSSDSSPKPFRGERVLTGNSPGENPVYWTASSLDSARRDDEKDCTTLPIDELTKS